MVAIGRSEEVGILSIFPYILAALVMSMGLSSCSAEPRAGMKPEQAYSAEKNPVIQRGINLGNALDAPSPGEWGVTIEDHYFRTIREAGFDGIRLPVRISAHTSMIPPYLIDSDFLYLVEEMVNLGLQEDLTVILDVHHYDEMMEDPQGELERFLSIWDQLGQHFQNAPDSLQFELLNEPTGNLDSDSWNAVLTEVLPIVRASNPDRTILIGGFPYNSIDALETLDLPADDNLVAVFHFYDPFEFTHQGASWVENSGQWTGTSWRGSEQDVQLIMDQLDRAAAWSAHHRVPLVMGEFGAIASADPASRSRWTETAARQAELRGISWYYWEFCSNFGVYDSHEEVWDMALLQALIPE
jgi:endoglucanase